VNIGDGDAKQKIEDEIFRLLADEKDPCSWHRYSGFNESEDRVDIAQD